MSQSKLRYLVLIILSLAVLSACSLNGSSKSTATTGVSSATQSTNPSSTPITQQATPAASSSATPDGISLDPPLLVAHAQSGTQQANFGTFYWMISSGLAAQVNARGIQIQDQALHVTKGETVQFTWTNQNSQSDSTLQDLTISVFPEAESIVTATNATGTLKGFKASANPVTTGKLSTSNPTWNVNVDSGSYFVQVVATWSNPIVAGGKTRQCEYGFYFTVG